MENVRYFQSNSYKSKATFWTLVFVIHCVHISSEIDGQTCSPTENESFIVDWDKPVLLKLHISSIWPNTGEDLVLKNDEGQVEGACSGRKSVDNNNILKGITCWSNVEKGFLVKSSGITCLVHCFIHINVSLTKHSSSGTYYLELNETRCQFLTAKIYYRDFKPTCSVLFHRESNYFKFSCTWTVGVRHGKARLLSGDLTLNDTEYNGIQSNQTSITKTISTSIDLGDMFSESKVPNICSVSESGFEQNCTFSPITQLSINELEETTTTLNCCSDTNSKPDIWIFNESNAFPVNTMVGPYKQEYSSLIDLQFGIVCGTSSETKLVIHSMTRLISKEEVITLSISNDSEGNASDHCKIIVTGLSGQPVEHDSTSILPMTSTIAYDVDNKFESTQSPIFLISQVVSSISRSAAWIVSPTESKNVISPKSIVDRMLLPLLVSSVLLLLFGAGMCLWFCRGRLLKLRYGSSPDGHDGTDTARSLHLPSTVDCGTGAEALQMLPHSSASHQSTTRSAPTHSSGEDGNGFVDEEVYSLCRLDTLGLGEHHYQHVDQEEKSEVEYCAYSSIDDDYCSVNDAKDLTHENLNSISYSDAWCGEKSQSLVSVRNTSEIEAIYAKSNKQRLLNVTNADIDSPSSCSSTFLDHHDVRHVETSVTGGSWNSESSTSDDDITEGYASVSGILKSNVEYAAISDTCDPITSSAYDTCCRNILLNSGLSTSIYAATTPNTSSEAIYDSLQRSKVEIEGFAKK